jgi:hypothetical protein
MFVQEPLLGLLGREGLEFYSRHLTELDDFWLEDSKMMTDGTSAAKYENVEENTNKALRNAGCELGCDDNEMMFKIKDQAWTSRRNEIEATEYDEKNEECCQEYNGFEQNLGQFDGWLTVPPCDNKSVEKEFEQYKWCASYEKKYVSEFRKCLDAFIGLGTTGSRAGLQGQHDSVQLELGSDKSHKNKQNALKAL